MDKVVLYSGSFKLLLIAGKDGPSISFMDPDDNVMAAFPVKVSLLKSVAGGYSYQVANEFGSLRMALSDETVDVRFEGKNKENLKAKLEKEKFLELVSHLDKHQV